jgi:dienelactone hydrolase
LRDTHTQLADLLPWSLSDPLLGDDFATGPVDVTDHFGRKFEHQHTLWGNLSGLSHTAQCATAKSFDETTLPPWPGFDDVWIRVSDDLELSGRLGLRGERGAPERRTTIVVLPGFLGDNSVTRCEDLSRALLSEGFHVLALELRGCGKTFKRYPHAHTAWGLLESGELLKVSDWLQAQPYVLDTGLVGFCWGGNMALMAAWHDARQSDHPAITDALEPSLSPVCGGPHFGAGIMVFSTVPRFEELVESLEVEHSPLGNVIFYGFQSIVREGALKAGRTNPSGSLLQFIEMELAAEGLPPSGHAFRYMRLLDHAGAPSFNKLDDLRMPLLIVHSANDPLVPAQDVADLATETSDSNVGVLILPGGGHVGFAAYARAYYFSLIVNFFDRSP